MTEPTDEMIEQAGRALFGERPLNPTRRRQLRDVVAAVLAIVERNYDVRCGAVCDRYFGRCAAKPGHDGEHHNIDGDSVVFW